MSRLHRDPGGHDQAGAEVEMISAHDLDIAAKTVWGEARGEGDVGMLAGASGIVNRASKKDAHLADVCLKPFQFSCWNEGDPNKPAIEAIGPDDKSYRQALGAVLKAIDLPPGADQTRGATHYCHINSKPWWAKKMKETATIYNHRFYIESNPKDT